MTPAELLAQSLAALRNANRIDGTKASYRKDNPAEYAAVMAYLDGGPRPGGNLTLMGQGLVLEEEARRALVPPPPPPPPPAEWPASYYTGPLGAKNPLPPKGRAFLITWLSLPGGAITWEQWKQRVPQREADIGRKYDGLMIADWEHLWPEAHMQWIHDHGSIPIVANFTLNGAGTPAFTIAQIAAGAADSVIDRYADHWGSKDFAIVVRLMHEFDDPWAWGHSSVGQEQTWIAAWRRIVERFKARGADNVGFWWCPNEGVRRDAIDKSYPGDEYVDWVGSDWYNFQYVSDGGWSTPIHPGWAEFWEMFNYPPGDGYQSQHSKWGPRKPFVIGETNTVHDPSNPGKKPDWYRNVVSHQNGLKAMPYCTGVSFFDTDASGGEGARNNFNVDYPYNLPSVYEGWKAMAQDPYWLCQGA